MSDDDDLEDDSPTGPGRRYLTRAGAERMHAELLRLLNDERPRITAEVSAAAAQGDRSENAEYIYGKKRLREIDRRIRFLQRRLDTSTIVAPEDQTDTGRVWFGAVGHAGGRGRDLAHLPDRRAGRDRRAGNAGQRGVAARPVAARKAAWRRGDGAAPSR